MVLEGVVSAHQCGGTIVNDVGIYGYYKGDHSRRYLAILNI